MSMRRFNLGFTVFMTSACLALGLACAGDDGDTSTTADENAGSSESESDESAESGESGGDVGTEGESETGMETDDTTSTTPDGGPECGEMQCFVGEVCLTFPQAPTCSPKAEDQPCPEGTTESQCGGAGLPCCCEPPPPTIYECREPPSSCGEPADCACLAEVCVPACEMSAQPNVFICEEPPAP